jgi:peptidoglycan/xylan/chitin deacetylase (PgdA/CDA1 family)
MALKIKLLIVKIIRYAIAFLGMLIASVKKYDNEIIILMYHRVNDDVYKELAVKERNFKWQMDYLFREKYKVISMDEAYFRARTNSINQKYVVLTFDDGYEDFITAFPILEKYEFPSILYIVPNYIESGKTFWWDSDIGESKLLSWEQLKGLGESNLIDFGSHSMNHIDLNTLEGQELKHEITASKEILENKLGKKIVHFSYPRGIYSNETLKIVKKFYNTGVLIYDGAEVNNEIKYNDMFKLKRIPVQNSDGKYLFAARIKGWIKPEETIRNIINKFGSLKVKSSI